MCINNNDIFDVFLSHSHNDAVQVHHLAKRLEDEHNLKVWLDKWILIPGKPFIQEMSKGLESAKSCAIIIGNSTPKGWFKEEIGKALNRQVKDNSFNVIPILLPVASPDFVNDFLELRTWVHFKNGLENKRAFWELYCGIKNITPGRKYLDIDDIEVKVPPEIKKKLEELQSIDHLIEYNVKVEIQRKILINHFKIDG